MCVYQTQLQGNELYWNTEQRLVKTLPIYLSFVYTTVSPKYVGYVLPDNNFLCILDLLYSFWAITHLLEGGY